MHLTCRNNTSVSEHSEFTVNRLLENKYANSPANENKHGEHESARVAHAHIAA